ncbi:MAG: membrane protein insertase YidC [Halieaceae bacterium]|nr:membrane protein insertase YidC [Halieaceae bacterium]
MDVIRSLLIGVIAVLSFMLLTEWVNFQEARAPAALPPNAPSQVVTSSDSELPAAPVVTDSEDIPEVEAPANPTPVVNTGETISVTTDRLQIRIDLTGGDITEVALIDYPARIESPEIPFLLLEDNQRRSYIAQSGLIGQDGIDSQGRARFATPARAFTLADTADELVVDLIAVDTGDIDITKRFTFTRGDYLVRVEYLVTNNSSERWQANLFGQIKRDSSDDPSAELSSGMGMVPFLGAATTLPDERFAKYDFEDMREKPLKEKIEGGWIAMIQHYFLSAWIPDANQSHNYNTRVTNNGFNIAGFVSPAITVDPGQQGSVRAEFYAGPKDQYRLAEISEYLDLSVDYGWLWWIAQPLFWLLIKIYSFVNNWGVAIIMLTLVIKAAFFKLSATSYRSMANMRRVQPQLQSIRERYAEDKQKQSQEMMNLYRKEKINPLSGCLPILVQMPVFIALYWVLMESVELRQAPFFGWIQDLSVMDPFFILPLIMGASMWFQQKLAPPPPDPMQAKIMQWMPIIFTFFFLWFPAGLVLYWVTNNLLSIAQQWYITRQIERAGSKA